MRDQKRKAARNHARALNLADSRKRVKLFNKILRSMHISPDMSRKKRAVREDAVAKKLAAHGFEIRVNRPQPMGSREERKRANIARRAKTASKGGNNEKQPNQTKAL